MTEDRDPLSSLDSPLSTLYAYDLLGNLDQETAPNGVITDYTYDDLNRLDEMVSFVDDGTVNGVYDSGSDTLIAGFDYTLREDGKRTGVTETFAGGLTNTISWDYDALGRLTEEDFNSSDNSLDYIHTYTFDLAGNRLTWELDTDHSGTVDETVTYTYDANDRLLEEDSTDGTTTTYGYSHTQQTSKTVVDSLSSPLSTLSFSYNLQGRMSSVLTETYSGGTLQSRQQVAYGYDDAGLRVSSQESVDFDLNGSLETLTTTTPYLFDSRNHTGYQQVLREVRVDEQTGESTVIDYTFGHDELVQTRRDFDDQGGLVSDVLLVFGHDGHGSVRVLTNLFGAIYNLASVTQIFHFDAYGNAVGFNPSQAATSLLYSGEFFDTGIGQQYLRARWYDPNTGRINPLDPFFGNLEDPLSLHKYRYTQGAPVGFSDPSGMYEGLVGTIASISIGIAVELLVPGPADLILSSYQSLLGTYIANLEWDIEWADNWDLPDWLNSRSDDTWVMLALLAGAYHAFDIDIPFTDITLNPIGGLLGGGGITSHSASAARPRTPSISRVSTGVGVFALSKIRRLADARGVIHRVKQFVHPRLGLRKPVYVFSSRAIKKEIRITPNGPGDVGRRLDIAAANKKFGKPADYNWEQEFGEPMTWHHDSRRGVLQLISRRLHEQTFPHVGLDLWFL